MEQLSGFATGFADFANGVRQLPAVDGFAFARTAHFAPPTYSQSLRATSTCNFRGPRRSTQKCSHATPRVQQLVDVLVLITRVFDVFGNEATNAQQFELAAN